MPQALCVSLIPRNKIVRNESHDDDDLGLKDDDSVWVEGSDPPGEQGIACSVAANPKREGILAIVRNQTPNPRVAFDLM